MDRNEPSDMTYDPLATAFNELYGLYKFTLTSPKLHSVTGINITYYLRVYMKFHTNGVTSDYVDFLLIKLESDTN